VFRGAELADADGLADGVVGVAVPVVLGRSVGVCAAGGMVTVGSSDGRETPTASGPEAHMTACNFPVATTAPTAVPAVRSTRTGTMTKRKSLRPARCEPCRGVASKSVPPYLDTRSLRDRDR
jgi:hypothetical protein